MSEFKLTFIFDEKQINKYCSDSTWKQSSLLPYFSEKYTCFSHNKDYSFEELINLYLYGNDDEQIGAISVIAERYANELYELICNQKETLPRKKIEFIFDYVVRDCLPLILPREKLSVYEFGAEYSNDIWVKILAEIKPVL